MQTKPVVMEKFHIVHTSFVVDLYFTNNITILMGYSGVGKTAVFSFIQECMSIDKRILCINFIDYQKNIGEIFKQTSGKLIVIDDADILLDSDARKHISLDEKNQYLIIGRNPADLFATKDNLFELVSTSVREHTVFTIKPYL